MNHAPVGHRREDRDPLRWVSAGPRSCDRLRPRDRAFSEVGEGDLPSGVRTTASTATDLRRFSPAQVLFIGTTGLELPDGKAISSARTAWECDPRSGGRTADEIAAAVGSTDRTFAATQISGRREFVIVKVLSHTELDGSADGRAGLLGVGGPAPRFPPLGIKMPMPLGTA